MEQIRQSRVVGVALYLALALAPVDAPCLAEAPPLRIVSLSPHITELLFAAGAGERVVGVDGASDYPSAAQRLPRLGEAPALDLETLLKLKPTLVIAWASGTPPRVVEELRRLKLRVIVTEQRRLDDIGDALLEFGRLAGTETAAKAAADRYRTSLQELRARYAGRPSLTVFYQVWDRPLYTLSGEHVVSEALGLCGGQNVFANLETLAPAVDRESVLARDPGVILIGASAAEGARQTGEWSRFTSLSAVRNRTIYTVNPSLLNRMAPRILKGVEEVCEALDEARRVTRLH